MKTVLRIFSVILLLALSATGTVRAFSPDSYTPSSVLAEGRWVKISVDRTGLYLISNSDLRSWGFSDPSKVNVYGYGGNRISDLLTPENYTDDLPQVQALHTSRGIVFYGVGTLKRSEVDNRGTHFHTQNPYSDLGYYYLSDREAETREIPREGREAAGEPVTTFIDGVRHETDEVSAMKSGHRMLGEDFRFTSARTFSFSLPDRVEGTDVWMQCDFYAIVNTSPLSLNFAVDGNALPHLSGDRVRTCASDEYGDSCRIRKRFELSGNSLQLAVSASSGGIIKSANLDNISVCYTRALRMPSSQTILFTIPAAGASPALAGATENTVVWDVSDPLNITEMAATLQGGSLSWTNDIYGARSYAAFNTGATFLTPRIASNRIANQDIHAEETPDMVIITHPELRAQAERVAALRSQSADSLKVLVLDTDKIYNEFSSGSPDVNAFRKVLKMFYDRADGSRLKYALLFGGVTYDHRRVTSEWKQSSALTIPVWQTDEARSESYSYSSDDPTVFLADNSGVLNGRDVMSIAVGRIPARSVEAAKTFVDKLIAYENTPGGDWRNRVLLLCDNGNNGIHLQQSEDVEQAMRSHGSGSQLTYHKIYSENYELQGGVATVGREKLHSLLSDGAVLWCYVGHGSTTSLTGNGFFTIKDTENFYQRRPSFFYGATCSFVWWDAIDEASLQKLTLDNPNGLIGGIAAVRPVLIARNGPLAATFGEEVWERDEDGRFRGVGEVMRRTKNAYPNETNKMRYVLLGDPSMRLAMPAKVVTLDSINGIPLTSDTDSEPACIHALSKVRLAGSVTDHTGSVDTAFDGYVSFTLYDAEKSVATVRGEYETPKVTDEMGARLYAGRAKVNGGHWSAEFVLPSEISDNYRPATLSLYAAREDGSDEAAGANRDFYVYGQGDDAIADDSAPVIEYLYLNHESFKDGDTVNDTPMLMARVSDDLSLNMSEAGIGHQMTLRIDNNLNFTDLSSSFTPDADGKPAGEIAYQIPALSTGPHTATLKVWDVVGNSTSASFDFFVDPQAAPKIFEVYSDANPATTEANFYIIHNRPEAMLTVRIDIYNIGGRLVWSSAVKGRADMFASSPVHWDLTDSTGRRVGRGIYVYRATVTSEGSGDNPSVSSSASRRIAVAPM